jgi:arabinose-5-phosphate isomerase
MPVKELIDLSKQYLDHYFNHLDIKEVNRFLDVFLQAQGVIFFTGVGKSGLIAQKIAVTMTSTGTRALYLSPTDALHGDIGMVTNKDVFVLLSKSGETDELLSLVPYIRNKGATLMSIVSNKESRLSRACDHHIHLPLAGELCPFNMAPTMSTTLQMIFGDILAIAMMRHKKFTLDEYASNHPAGAIGRKITLKVKDLMITGDKMPLCKPTDRLIDTLVELSNKRAGCVLIVNAKKRMRGIFTDGDLRRSLQKHGAEVMQFTMDSLMTTTPKKIGPNVLAIDALRLMEQNQNHPIMVLPVVEEDQTVVGLIKMHDIIQTGLSS